MASLKLLDGDDVRRLWRWVVLIIIAAVVAAAIWYFTPLRPLAGAAGALESGEDVLVIEDTWYTFTPIDEATTGLILYPGARIDPVAYAPPARAIAEAGFLTVLVPMPVNLAVLSPNRAEQVIEAHPEIDTWVIGGHSLGGAMAAQFANNHRSDIAGVILWGAYPGVNTSLRNAGQAVQVVYGTRDCISTPAEVKEALVRLPEESDLIVIEGGNHSQFGWYRDQPGSCVPLITLDEQQRTTIKAAVEFLEDLDR